MYIKLYKDLVINYGDNIHIINSSEVNFQLQISRSLVETITDTAALNYLPNTKQFEIKLTNMANAPRITYIIWYTNNAYKHFRVINYQEFYDYATFTCESDLWADGICENRNIYDAKMRIIRSNMQYTDASENVIPYSYDTINYTNKKFTDYNFGASEAGGNITTFTKTYLVAFDRQVDAFDAATLFFGATWQSVLATFSEVQLDNIKKLVSCGSGDKVRIKAIYILPFTPTTSGILEVFYKGQPSNTHEYVNIVNSGIYYTTKKLAASIFDYGNNKIYVGAGDSVMLLENIGPASYVDYRFILDDFGVTAYVSQGDNSKDITDAYTLKVTSNDTSLTLQESLAKITGAGFKALSGALMLGSPATAVGGLASITGAGLDLVPSSKAASYTLDGNAVSTYADANATGFSYRVYKAINDMSKINAIIGVNYNYVTDFNSACKGNAITQIVDKYLQGDLYIRSLYYETGPKLNVEEYNFIINELKRGIYIDASNM